MSSPLALLRPPQALVRPQLPPSWAWMTGCPQAEGCRALGSLPSWFHSCDQPGLLCSSPGCRPPALCAAGLPLPAWHSRGDPAPSCQPTEETGWGRIPIASCQPGPRPAEERKLLAAAQPRSGRLGDLGPPRTVLAFPSGTQPNRPALSSTSELFNTH